MQKSATFLANEEYGRNGLEVWREFQEETKDPMGRNTALLMKLLEDNKDTEYGKRFGFGEIHSVEEYQRRVPVITYDSISGELERMMRGEKNILTAYPFSHFNETSGTVGVPEVVPMTEQQSAVFERYNSYLTYGVMMENLDPDWMEGRAFSTASGNCRELDNGLTVGEASAKIADFIKGGEDAVDVAVRTMYTSPLEAINPAPGVDSKYIHTRFSLMDREVRGMITGFYSVAVLFLRYIANNYELLIDDIEKGTISDMVDMPDDVRESLLRKIEPMPERAAELREIFKDGADFPFVKKVWPHFCCMNGVGGDGFEIYDRQIKEQFLGEGVTHIYSGITASEGLWAVTSGVNDFDAIIAPCAAFMEFLPVEAGDDFTQCVTMDKLEVGKVYELIITNLAGFYRYRMSDAVKVTGFYNKAPRVQFMYRVNKTINLMEEKTTEKALQITVENAAEELGIELADYAVYPDASAAPNNYVFLIEPRRDLPDFDMEKLRESVFRHLCKANPVYYDCYADHWLGMPEVYFLQPETQLLYRDVMVYRGSSLNQLKPVHVIMNETQRRFFFALRQY